MIDLIKEAFSREAQGWQRVEVEVEHRYDPSGTPYTLIRDGLGYSAEYRDHDTQEGRYWLRKSDWADIAHDEPGHRGAAASAEGQKRGFRLW